MLGMGLLTVQGHVHSPGEAGSGSPPDPTAHGRSGSKPCSAASPGRWRQTACS